MRYQPEASATLRLEVDGDGAPAVFAKHLADGTAPIASRHQALWSRSNLPPELRIAEPLAADPVREVLWTRGVPGRPVTEAVDPAQLPDATVSVGPMLAALHASAVPVRGRVDVDGLLAEAHSKATKLSRAHPAVGPAVNDLVAAATRRRAEAGPERLCTLHGDFHLAQLVWSEQGPVLVDLDSMTHGPPEVDLAEFLAELALRDLPRGIARGVASELLSSYSSASGTEIDAALLETCADVEFLNRCYRHLRRHSPGWQSDLAAALGRHAEMRSLLRP
ncbi:phosphotransferase [Nocardioides iriomotensis]|uniref:phosphotransferase n=1 Tax=Nocardioides iriomotensis TaxID=715784 RepID=UPI0013EDFD13|nr:phosphotransferase [Nocardioides iriomotensis]